MSNPKGSFVNTAHLKRNTPARQKREKKLSADAVRYQQQFSVTIPLAPQDKPIPLTPAFENVIYEEYLTRYLEASGVTASDSVLAAVRKHIPRSSIAIRPVWKSQGWKADVVRVTPINKPYTNDKWTAAPDDVLADAIRTETGHFRARSVRAGMIEPALPASLTPAGAAATIGTTAPPAAGTAAGGKPSGGGTTTIVSRFEAAPAVIIIPNTPPQSPKGGGKSKSKSDDPATTATGGVFGDESNGVTTAAGVTAPPKSVVAASQLPLPPRVVCCIHFRAAHAFLKLRRRTHQPWWWSLLTADDARLNEILNRPKKSDEYTDGGSGSAIDDRHHRHRLLELRIPISVSLSTIEELQRLFFLHFPFDRFSKPYTAAERRSALALLTGPSTIQLVGLLCHALYWLLFGAHAVEPLSASETESVLLAVEKLYADVTNGTDSTHTNSDSAATASLDGSIGQRVAAPRRVTSSWRLRPNYSLLYLPLLLDSMCSTVQNVFRMSFPKWFTGSAAAATTATAAHHTTVAADGYTPLGADASGTPIRLGAGSHGLDAASGAAAPGGGNTSVLANQAASDSLAALTDAHIVRTIDQLFDAQHYLSLSAAAPVGPSAAASRLPPSITAAVFGSSSAAAAMSANGMAITQSIAHSLTHPNQAAVAATVNPAEAAVSGEASGARAGSLQQRRRLDKLFHTTSHLVRSIFPKPRAFGARNIALTGTERRYTSHVRPPPRAGAAATGAAAAAAAMQPPATADSKHSDGGGGGGRRSVHSAASVLSRRSAADLLSAIDEKQAADDASPVRGSPKPATATAAVRRPRNTAASVASGASTAGARATRAGAPPGAAPIMELSTAARQQLYNIALQNIASRRVHQASIL